MNQEYRSEFPTDFLWGGAISANQSEGAWIDGKGLDLACCFKEGLHHGFKGKPVKGEYNLNFVKNV